MLTIKTNMVMPKYYTVQEVADTLQVHWQSVLNYIKSGKLEAVKLGKGYRISEVALQVFIADRSTRKKQ
jgi:excisionase family DNA binding protein